MDRLAAEEPVEEVELAPPAGAPLREGDRGGPRPAADREVPLPPVRRLRRAAREAGGHHGTQSRAG